MLGVGTSAQSTACSAVSSSGRPSNGSTTTSPSAVRSVRAAPAQPPGPPPLPCMCPSRSTSSWGVALSCGSCPDRSNRPRRCSAAHADSASGPLSSSAAVCAAGRHSQRAAQRALATGLTDACSADAHSAAVSSCVHATATRPSPIIHVTPSSDAAWKPATPSASNAPGARAHAARDAPACASAVATATTAAAMLAAIIAQPAAMTRTSWRANLSRARCAAASR
eukprot:356602-Chlamydomonas_euryale.AAC.2